MQEEQKVWPHGVTNGHTSWSQQIGQRSASLERFAFVRVISLVCESRRRRGASARLSRFLLSRGVISVTTSPLSPTAGVGTACINTALAPGIRLHNCAGAATLGWRTYKSGTGEHGHAGFRRPAAAVGVKVLSDSVRCQQVLPTPRILTSPQPPVIVA